jgi:ABC-type bacteriocin/lantibiotic exporter with double-glycine peptidase domain
VTVATLKPFERKRFVAEVVQTSSMDCGPAALKCLLEGFNISASYGRLREACQTDVDGTSIDTIEDIASDLGLVVEQCLIPVDHAMMDESGLLPAIAVVSKTTDAATHFVVVWRRHGRWLQLMDPAIGRRWVKIERFNDELYRHTQSVDAEEWREWASGDEFTVPLAARLARIGIGKSDADALIADALADPVWLPIAGLDASVRLVQSMVDAKGVKAGAEALNVVRALYRDTSASRLDVQAFIPGAYWSVSPDPESIGKPRRRLMAKGAVLLTVKGVREATADFSEDPPELSLELAAALSEKQVPPLATLWRMLVADGLVTPFALITAMAVAAGALMLEALLFRGLFDIASQLALPSQRLFAGIGLVIFVAILLGIDIAIGLQTLRMGRKLETRLRMALLEKLPRLNDRYFQSRPITDMADRNHNIHLTRGVPSSGLQLVQSIFELALTFIGVVLIAPGSLGMALLLVAVAIAIPLITQQLLNERDLRVRNHAGALHSFYLDALLGLTPVRAHRAERNVQGRHEGLLVEWALSLRGLIRMSLMTDGFQALICTGLAGMLLINHFISVGSVSGSDLLLIFWTLKLPAIGARLAGIAHQYPAQRNVLLRMMEPLNAPDAIEAERDPDQEQRMQAAAAAGKPIGFRLENASVLAGGHEILRDVSLSVAPGEHVAVVGLSGAGKSSMLGLLLGWHRLSSGQLLVDDMPLDNRAVEALRQVTAWVDPAIQIWNRSLLDNLTYAAEGDAIDRVGEVIGAAKLRNVAQKLPEGLQSLLGEGGGMLSGGEGQRVRLGRALLATDSRLVLLDEPFRGMDRTQRQTLLVEARAWWQQVTMLCVTHDVSETMAFPRVLVVEEGRIVEDGVPAILAKQPSRYRDLLEAEAVVAKQIWRGDYWRRLEMTGGRLVETGAQR